MGPFNLELDAVRDQTSNSPSQLSYIRSLNAELREGVMTKNGLFNTKFITLKTAMLLGANPD
ncbi:hypothetical protein J1614_011187 [Plenodomus biglobosus]|nr:hypothetical protein J1614_011187 [Plenodomus biglobosus]